MNPKKICFIYCVNNDAKFTQSWNYLCQLSIPTGYTVEIRAVKNMVSITNGYNYAMDKSDAKYKVYLHQDVDILNQSFLADILYLFMHFPQLGMLGMIGAKQLPVSGIWWEANRKYGKVYAAGELAFNNVIKKYESVQAIDGLLMITQFDLPWREDLFKGWHFYDISQSLEFLKAGYTVGIPNQRTPWCRHNFGDPDLTSYDRDRRIFIQAYKNMINKPIS